MWERVAASESEQARERERQRERETQDTFEREQCLQITFNS